ncbi:MAG: glycine cleavage system aminomethyltransferase GcvT [Planctomycetota bacterium]
MLDPHESAKETLDAPSDVKKTPLDGWHRDNGATMVPFAGYDMPIQYGSIVSEHVACRTAAALFDVSHMGRLRFEGADAGQLLDHLLTRRVSDMPAGHVRYGLMCNADGGVLDDVLVSHIETPSGQDYYLMVVNASNREKLLHWIVPHLSDFPTVRMTDRTELTAMIAVQGPQAIPATSRLFDYDPARLGYYKTVVTQQMKKPVIVSRTGYTGEDGIELIVRAEEAPRIWENLMMAGRDAGFIAAGLGARDTLRLEAGMPLYGHELGEQIDPLSAGLKFACNLKERSFIGDDALRGIAENGAPRQRVGLIMQGRRPAREECPVVNDAGDVIGMVSSGAPSPTLGVPIAMAMIDVAAAGHRLAADDSVGIDIRGRVQPATICPLPFYKRER